MGVYAGTQAKVSAHDLALLRSKVDPRMLELLLYTVEHLSWGCRETPGEVIADVEARAAELGLPPEAGRAAAELILELAKSATRIRSDGGLVVAVESNGASIVIVPVASSSSGLAEAAARYAQAALGVKPSAVVVVTAAGLVEWSHARR